VVRLLSQGTTINNFLKNTPVLRSQLAEIFRLSEDNLIDKLKLSHKELTRLSYDIYVLKENKFIKNKFATILKAEVLHDLPSKRKNFYLICLNKNRIFKRNNPFLKELLLYILTHELVHLVRFIRYESSFYFKNKWQEEKTVHKITKELLKNLKFLPRMEEILNYFDKIYS